AHTVMGIARDTQRGKATSPDSGSAIFARENDRTGMQSSKLRHRPRKPRLENHLRPNPQPTRGGPSLGVPGSGYRARYPRLADGQSPTSFHGSRRDRAFIFARENPRGPARSSQLYKPLPRKH